MKKNYAKIKFVNCSLDYSLTICPWNEAADYLSLVKEEIENFDHSKNKSSNLVPSVVISSIAMSDEEYGVWFDTYVLPTA